MNFRSHQHSRSVPKQRPPEQLIQDPQDGCFDAVHGELIRLVNAYLPAQEREAIISHLRPRGVVAQATEDLHTLADRDPAALQSWEYVWESYTSYRAVLAYRLSHMIYRMPASGMTWRRRRSATRRIGESAKVETGVEIHPGAVIGRRFVLDHATGTVIGETTLIGDDCYLLQGIVLGARGISGNAPGRRHPRLGHRVQVGAFTKVLGPVSIGDDVLLGPGVIITNDIPSRTRVRLVTQYQSSSPLSGVRIYGVVPRAEGTLDIHGTGLAEVHVDLLYPDGEVMAGIPILARDEAVVRCSVPAEFDGAQLRLTEPNGAQTVVGNLRPAPRERCARNSVISVGA